MRWTVGDCFYFVSKRYNETSIGQITKISYVPLGTRFDYNPILVTLRGKLRIPDNKNFWLNSPMDLDSIKLPLEEAHQRANEIKAELL